MSAVVELTNITKKEYGMFFYLRKLAPNANIDTLKQISVYIAISTDDNFDIDKNCSLKMFSSSMEDECFLLSIFDGRKILFSNNSSIFGFSVLNYNVDNHIYMESKVYEKHTGDLSTLIVYSEVITRDFGKYVVTFRPNNMCDDKMKFGTINYYTEDEVSWVYEVSGNEKIDNDFDLVAKNNGIYPFAEKIYFDVPLQYMDTELDCYEGYLKNYLHRVDLLYKNVLVYIDTVDKRKVKKI